MIAHQQGISHRTQIILADGSGVFAKSLYEDRKATRCGFGLRLDTSVVSLCSLVAKESFTSRLVTTLNLGDSEEIFVPNQMILTYDIKVRGSYSFSHVSSLTSSDKVVICSLNTKGERVLNFHPIKSVRTEEISDLEFITFEIPLFRNMVLSSGLVVNM